MYAMDRRVCSIVNWDTKLELQRTDGLTVWTVCLFVFFFSSFFLVPTDFSETNVRRINK